MTGAWDVAYAEGGVPTWDLGRPQPAVIRLAESGAFGPPGSTIIDAGCGTGENALLLAARGHRVVGIDIAWEAIQRARAKAAERRIEPAPVFVVGNALAVPAAGGATDAGGAKGALAVPAAGGAKDAAGGAKRQFDVALDVGLFHALGDDEGPRYAASLASAVRPGGRAYVLCWSDRNPFGLGPRRVTRRELRSTFRASAGWRVDSIEDEELASRLPGRVVHAWLARLTRRA